MRISPEIENLSFDEQLIQYFTELLELHPECRLEEPSPEDDQVRTIILSNMHYYYSVYNIARV